MKNIPTERLNILEQESINRIQELIREDAKGKVLGGRSHLRLEEPPSQPHSYPFEYKERWGDMASNLSQGASNPIAYPFLCSLFRLKSNTTR